VTVVVNGEPHELHRGATVADVVALLGRGPQGLAVAVNEEVVPRTRWPGTTLSERDRVEVLTAAAGG
jgi:sulfur carrier protein